MNKKERRAALKSALTSKVQDNKLVVVDSLALAEVKTKEMQRVLTNLKAEKALVITASDDKNVVLSARNIADVQTATVNTMNAVSYTHLHLRVCPKTSLHTPIPRWLLNSVQ